MFKLVQTHGQAGTPWDHQGKTNISQIFISYSDHIIDSIQFSYIEDGRVVLSERIGREEGCDNFKTITFNYPSEYITRVRGCYETAHHGKTYLGSITLFTNKGKYGPYEPPCLGDESDSQQKEFDYEVAAGFYGFFGTYWEDGIETIGVYAKPVQVRS